MAAGHSLNDLELLILLALIRLAPAAYGVPIARESILIDGFLQANRPSKTDSFTGRRGLGASRA